MYQVVIGITFLAGLTLTHIQHPDIVGAWHFNPEVSSPVPPHADDHPASRRDGPSRDGTGTAGMLEGSSERDMRQLRMILRRLEEPPASLTIVRYGDRVILTNGEGRTVTYAADGRNEEHVSGDGEFTSRAQFEGEVLVVEEDFGGGMKLTSRYEPVAGEGAQFLEVTLNATGLPKLRRPGADSADGLDAATSRMSPDGVLRVYERAP